MTRIEIPAYIFEIFEIIAWLFLALWAIDTALRIVKFIYARNLDKAKLQAYDDLIDNISDFMGNDEFTEDDFKEWHEDTKKGRNIHVIKPEKL